MAPIHKNLADKLPQACRNTVLSAADMTYPSFQLKYGFTWGLSAADAVHALTGIMIKHSAIGGSGSGEGGKGADGERTPEEVRAAQAEAMRDDFWCVGCSSLWQSCLGRGWVVGGFGVPERECPFSCRRLRLELNPRSSHPQGLLGDV